MVDYKWKPIEPLSEKEKGIDLAAIESLYETWRSSRVRLEQSNPSALKGFQERLVRRLSIETGILEQLYDLDRGTTEALVAHGFADDLVAHSASQLPPSRLIDILKDQEAAIQLVVDCVARNREMTKGVIHELHAVLTRHQDTTTAVDQFGSHFEIALLKGRYKQQPNNPKRPDGTIHEYCPPVQVEGEMDNFLSLLSGYSTEDPIIVASWLHHRFAQIHPYQDGNGRVGRALTALVLLRAKLLPLVVDRDLRVEYIHALERADGGDLADLASIFARLERAAILQALSVDADSEIAPERTPTSAVIEDLAEKFRKRRQVKREELRRVNEIAVALRVRAHTEIEVALGKVGTSAPELADADVFVGDGGADRGNAHWYKFEVVEWAKEAGKFANFEENHYFAKGSLRLGRERLIFVTSFHHVGRELSGIMEATAFSKLESFEDSEDRKAVSTDFFVCSPVEPFVFTYKTNEADIAASFSRWLDAALAVALKEYGERL